MPSERKAFLLRLDPKLLEAMQRWANDDLRSLNGQIEFILRQALAAAARKVDSKVGTSNPPPSDAGAGEDEDDTLGRR